MTWHHYACYLELQRARDIHSAARSAHANHRYVRAVARDGDGLGSAPRADSVWADVAGALLRTTKVARSAALRAGDQHFHRLSHTAYAVDRARRRRRLRYRTPDLAGPAARADGNDQR